MKPAPADIQDLYLRSLEILGLDLDRHDVRFVEDDWESPTLGAWGLGWEVWLNGMEVTQFTYFQQCGGFEGYPISVELTYGLERLAMYLQGVDNVYDLSWVEGISYRDVFLRNEREQSAYNFEHSPVEDLSQQFQQAQDSCRRLAEAGLALPAYDQCCKRLPPLQPARRAGSPLGGRAGPVHPEESRPCPSLRSGLAEPSDPGGGAS